MGSSRDGVSRSQGQRVGMSGVPSRSSVGISGLDAPAVVQVLLPPEVDRASFPA